MGSFQILIPPCQIRKGSIRIGYCGFLSANTSDDAVIIREGYFRIRFSTVFEQRQGQGLGERRGRRGGGAEGAGGHGDWREWRAPTEHLVAGLVATTRYRGTHRLFGGSCIIPTLDGPIRVDATPSQSEADRAIRLSPRRDRDRHRRGWPWTALVR